MPHLLLVAMSGVRIVNPDLAALGLTLPGFIERGKVIASLPSLGLLSIAGATPDHWHITYRAVDAMSEDVLSSLSDLDPDLVAVSALSARVDDAYFLLDFFRARGVKTVLGGLHASILPDEAAVHADCVVRGQGEWLWPTLLTDFESGNLQKLYDGMYTSQPLDSAQLPRYDLLNPDSYNRLPLQTTRGCPLDCSFCAASRLISPYKRKSIARIREEIDAICRIWPEPFIELADDNTFVNKQWGRELAECLADYPDIKWFTESDISLADDDRLLDALARSGCAQVLIGLESPTQDSLSETDTGGWKRRQGRDYMAKIRRIQDAGISVNGCFVFGFDHDTSDTFSRTWEFIQESELSEVQITLMTPFPGTALAARLRQEGRLLRDRYWNQCTLFDLTYQPAHFSVEELENRFAEMVSTVYSPEASAWRASKRRSIYRARTRHELPQEHHRASS
ncbi:MAG: B12-binding domain-containing radical SAM protein [Fimbriimonadaceae bacterium]|nr:B12-binding domain-containing radical SAM protein [Fimbriimonadaceae bacterium]